MRIDHQAFYSSLFLSRLADQVLLFLVPLVVFQTTHSAAWTGIAFFAETLPRFLAFPIAGVLCDRRPPLQLLRTSQSLRAVVCIAGAVGFLVLGGIAWLVALSALCGAFTTQGHMAREVMLPQVFKGERFEKVLAHAQIADQLGMVLGPLAAALALEQWPWAVVVAATAGVFLLADAAIALWRHVSTVQLAEPEVAAHGHWLQPMQTALSQVWRLSGLKPLIVLTAGVNLVLGVTLATSAVMVTGWFHRSSGDYALLQTAGAVSTVLVLLWIARQSLTLKTMLVVSYVCIFAGGLLTAVATSAWAYTLGFLLVIGFDKMFSVCIRSFRQKVIPRNDLGKTTGVIVLLNNLSQPLAGLVVGMFAGQAQSRGVILALTLGMGLLGISAMAGVLAQRWLRRP